MEKLHFLYEESKKNWGSTIIRGFDIASALNCDISSETETNIKDQKVIILKFYNYKKVLNFTDNNETIIDMNDYMPYVNMPYKIFHYAIFSSENQMNKYRELFIYPEKCVVIYHHWDRRLKNIEIDDNKEPKIAYIGKKGKCFMFDKIDNIDFYDMTNNVDDFDKYISVYKKYNIHYIIKPPEFEKECNSVTKLSTAAALNCPVIALKDSYNELLENYPFYVNSLTEIEIKKTINKIISSYKKDDWFISLEIMKKIKEITRFENTIKLYENLML